MRGGRNGKKGKSCRKGRRCRISYLSYYSYHSYYSYFYYQSPEQRPQCFLHLCHGMQLDVEFPGVDALHAVARDDDV